MSGRDGFQPCEMDTGTPSPIPHWEKTLVLSALAVHVLDVGLDLLVALLFFIHSQWVNFVLISGVIIWAWIVSSLYITFGGARPQRGDIDDGDVADQLPRVLNFVQIQIFAEAYHCIVRNGDTDYFHTLRLMEAILESAPNALVQLYALVTWAGANDVDSVAPDGAAALLQFSVMASFVSVGLGLAMWEQKVQFQTSAIYVASVAVVRAFEIASRSLTLAAFAGFTAHPYGIVCALLLDYTVMIFLIARHQSVQFTYGLFVAIPLVLVSLEPLVWRREDRAVPADLYYAVRIVEFIAMWVVILHVKGSGAAVIESTELVGCETWALLTTLGLFVLLPFVWHAARKHELSRDVADWAEDGVKEGLHGEGVNSDSELSQVSSGSGAEDMPGE